MSYCLKKIPWDGTIWWWTEMPWWAITLWRSQWMALQSYPRFMFNLWKSCTHLPLIFYSLNLSYAQFEWNWRSIHRTEMCCFCLVRKMHFLCELRITLKSIIDIFIQCKLKRKIHWHHLTNEIDNIGRYLTTTRHNKTGVMCIILCGVCRNSALLF